jgi:dATP pyrophosphohydrolase
MISINTSLVGSHIIRIRPNGSTDCLILRRSEDTKYYPGTWQILTGHVQEGETAVDAVIREMHEETGLRPLVVYSMNHVIRFYEHQDDSIYLVPLFICVVPYSARIKLNSKEHQRYKWCNLQEGQRNLYWLQHRRSLTQVQREFIDKTPEEWLKVYETQPSID